VFVISFALSICKLNYLPVLKNSLLYAGMGFEEKACASMLAYSIFLLTVANFFILYSNDVFVYLDAKKDPHQ